MAQPLKICAKCLAYLRQSGEGQQDLAAYLMGIGAGGIEIVPVEDCQARLNCHKASPTPAPAVRGLADVTPEEIDAAIAGLLEQLKLPSGRRGEAWDLANAVKAEWLKALEIRRRQSEGQ